MGYSPFCLAAVHRTQLFRGCSPASKFLKFLNFTIILGCTAGQNGMVGETASACMGQLCLLEYTGNYLWGTLKAR
jgi:hypothetical protein